MENKLLNQQYNQFVLYLSLSVPFLLISGPLLPDLVISIISLIFIVKLLKFKNYRLFFFTEKKIFFFILLFFIYINLISIFSIDKYLSFKNTIPFFRFFLFSSFLYFIISEKKKFFDKISIIFLLTLFLFLIDILLEIIFGTGISKIFIETTSSSYGDRFSSFFGDEHILGSYISRLLPFFISCLIISNLKHKKYIFFAILILSFILILLSGERVSFVFYLITFFHLIFIKKLKKSFFIIFSIFFVIIFTLNEINFKPTKRIIQATFKQINPSMNFFNSKNKNIIERDRKFFIFSERHESHYFAAFEIFKKNILFGTGPNTFRAACEKKEFSNETRLKMENESYYYAQTDLIVTPPVTPAPIITNKELNYPHHVDYVLYALNGEFPLFQVRRNERWKWKLIGRVNRFISKGDPVFKLVIQYPTGCNTHPHNIPMQFLSELGLIGFLFLLIFYIFFIYEYFKTIMKLDGSDIDMLNSYKFAYIFVILSFIINFFPFLPNGNFFNNWISILFYYPLAIMFFLKNKIKYE